MPVILRSALVEHAAARMFALVNDVAAYPRRFDWCREAQVLEQGDDRLVARLDLGLGGFHTWFTTENTLSPPHHIDMALRDGPFRRLDGRWQFHYREMKLGVRLELVEHCHVSVEFYSLETVAVDGGRERFDQRLNGGRLQVAIKF